MRVIVTDDQMKLKRDVEKSVRILERVGWNAQYGEETKARTDVYCCKHVRKSKDEHDEEECEAVLPQRPR